MAHNHDSKTEILKIRVDKELDNFLNTIANKNPNSPMCKTKLEDFFLRFGILESFSEHFNYDMSNFEDIFKVLNKIAHGHEFNRIINKVTYYKVAQR